MATALFVQGGSIEECYLLIALNRQKKKRRIKVRAQFKSKPPHKWKFQQTGLFLQTAKKTSSTVSAEGIFRCRVV